MKLKLQKIFHKFIKCFIKKSKKIIIQIFIEGALSSF